MDRIIDLFSYTFLDIEVWVYLAAFGAIFISFVLKKIIGAVLNRFVQASEKTKFRFDDVFFIALVRPAEWAVMVLGLFVALSILPIPDAPIDIRRFVTAAISGATVALVVWFAVRLIDGLADIWMTKASATESKLDDQLVPIVRRSTKVFLVIIGVVLVLQNLGYSVGSLLAGLGIGGVAIAMASKDTVANLFGSLVIFLDKPFQIGDWIETGDIEGTVEEVGLRTTRVRTFANSLITVPNLLFTTQAINNWSRMKKRRIKMSIGVTYSSSPDKIDGLVNRLREIIEEDNNIRNDFYLVNFDNFGPSSLDIFIYCFTVTTNWAEFLQAKQELLLKMMEAVNALGLSFAFPTQSVHVESLPTGAPESMIGERPR
jgi:MscS family membrane protein